MLEDAALQQRSGGGGGRGQLELGGGGVGVCVADWLGWLAWQS